MPPLPLVVNATTMKSPFRHLIDFPFRAPGILSDPIYRPLSITFIEYQDGDKLGLILAWFSMLPFIYIVSLCTLIIFRRDIQTIMYLGGFFVSGIINHFLKIICKQERPERTRNRVDFYEIYGMPSAHAQSFFYFMTYMAIFVILKSQMPGSSKTRPIRHRLFVFAQILAAILVAYKFISTTIQLLRSWSAGVLYVPLIVEHPLAKYLLIRDYSSIPHIIHFQYENEYNEAKRCRDRYANSNHDQITMEEL
ncbi:unnamed protein product [Adineta ricciae]|uniref:Phosphatidic acid phosphatase type 2/haloperoxidase domain-containing protein n=1 Tax=Adineta ricciae TaxID=249248 RepID=A0A814BDW9_ADIRI|nr:unnamed protein product [Adineta ricciae]